MTTLRQGITTKLVERLSRTLAYRSRTVLVTTALCGI